MNSHEVTDNHDRHQLSRHSSLPSPHNWTFNSIRGTKPALPHYSREKTNPDRCSPLPHTGTSSRCGDTAAQHRHVESTRRLRRQLASPALLSERRQWRPLIQRPSSERGSGRHLVSVLYRGLHPSERHRTERLRTQNVQTITGYTVMGTAPEFGRTRGNHQTPHTRTLAMRNTRALATRSHTCDTRTPKHRHTYASTQAAHARHANTQTPTQTRKHAGQRTRRLLPPPQCRRTSRRRYRWRQCRSRPVGPHVPDPPLEATPTPA